MTHDGTAPEITGPLHPAAEGDYLSAAANWLELAEEALDERAERLTELNIRMAGACGTYQYRQRYAAVPLRYTAAVSAPDWIGGGVPAVCGKCSGRHVGECATPADPADAVRAAAKADADARSGEPIAPGVDPEPVEEGTLLTSGGGWFYFSVNVRPGTERWLLVRHYAQFLRWKHERGTKPMAATWSEVAADIAEEHGVAPGEAYSVLRRPTAAERAEFYGPEPDPAVDNAPTPPEAACHQFVALEGVLPATTTLCERCGASAEAHLIKMFGQQQGGSLADQIKSAETRAMLTPTQAAPPEPDEMYSEGAARALERCSKAADAAGKTRTAQWLYACAKASRAGIVDWPDAPAYKGPVVHVNLPSADLEALTDGQIRGLRNTLNHELNRRGV